MTAAATLEKPRALPQHVILRAVLPEDNAQLARLVLGVLEEMQLSGEGCAGNDPQVHRMAETYALPGCTYFVAERAGEILGGGGIAPLQGGEADVCELQKTYLLPAARGIGLGKLIIEQCLQAARAHGYARCYLETYHTMQAAIALYERMGFTRLSAPMGATGHFQCTHWYLKELTDA